MYVIDRAKKGDAARQWALPDRVFFACGACQVLAYVAEESFRQAGFRTYWLRPAANFRGNHIILSDGRYAFDYHGWSKLGHLLEHAVRKANRWWPGWSCEMLPVAPDILISEAKSKAMGLQMREPGQFLHDALPRARAFLAARPPPPEVIWKSGSLGASWALPGSRL
jgi:hypothetical protein